MDTRRLLLFAAASFCFLFLWQNVGPRLFPGMFPPAVQVVPADPDGLGPDAGGGPAAANAPANAVAGADAAGEPADSDTGGDRAPAAEADPVDLPDYPDQTVTLGSTDAESGYRMRVTISSRGAAVTKVELSDPRYRELEDRDKPLRVVGNVPDPPLHSFALFAPKLDPALAEGGARIQDVPWEVVQGAVTDESVTFRYPLPSGLTLEKQFTMSKSEAGDTAGHLLAVSVRVANTTDAARPLDYWLQGPVGVPLESLDSTRTFVEIKGAVVEDTSDPGDYDVTKLTASEIVEAVKSGKPPRWSSALRWVGPEVQYFAALLLPEKGEPLIRGFDVVRPTVVQATSDVRHSSVSVLLHAKPETLAPGETSARSLTAYFGPKDKDMLAALGAGGSIDFGWFGAISRLMLTVLHFFHDTAGLPYALAIMLLTCCVRLCLMPITLKVAANGEKMKEMQPKIEELKEKYKDDREALGKAQMELMMKEGNPVAGCLPLLLQFPVFIGLYNALLNSVDLRLARFLWADNLAAPDHLASFGVKLPLLGEWFNLLPLVVVALFIGQQKMFMPPAVSDEQRAQYKLMNFMMLFMGFMFYSVPAGLCLYFIASSVWSMTERTAIKRKWIKLPEKKNKPKKPPGKFKTYLKQKFEEAQLAADAARNEGQGQLPPGGKNKNLGNNGPPPSGGRGGKKSKRRR